MNKSKTIATAATYCILFTNDIACSIMVDLISDIKRSPFYKHEVKKLTNTLEREMKIYERKVERVAKEKINYLADACELFSEEVSNDIKKFEYSLKRVLDRSNIDNAMFISKLECARAILRFSIISIDARVKEIRQYIQQVNSNQLDYLKMEKCLFYTAALVDLFEKQTKGVCDFNADANCKLAFNVIELKLTDCRKITSAIEKACEIIYT